MTQNNDDIINMAAPINVHADAAAILNLAARSAALILSRRAQMDRQGQSHKALIVLAGEIHPMPAFTLYQSLLFSELARQESVLVCMETEHSHMRKAYNKITGAAPASKAFNQAQNDGSTILKAKLAEPLIWTMNHAVHSQYLMLIDKKIPVRFTDADVLQKDRDLFLNFNDPTTRLAAESAGIKRRTHIYLASPSGIAARNLHMLKSASTHAKDLAPRILIQQCGNSHVLGKPKSDIDPAHSLAAKYIRAGEKVVAIYDDNHIQSRLFRKLTHINLHGLPRVIIGDSPLKNTLLNAQNTLTDERSIAAYCNEIMGHLGLEKYALSAGTMKGIMGQFKDEIRAQFKAIERNAPKL